MMSPVDLLFLSEAEGHTLLEPPATVYSKITMRRAFVVWLHCGQINTFPSICQYYHRLEKLEETMTTEQRKASYRHELNILSSQPPNSYLLEELFPNLYAQTKINREASKGKIEEAAIEDVTFGLEGMPELQLLKGERPKEMKLTSKMVRGYCKIHQKSLKKFLKEFKMYNKITETEYDVNNIRVFVLNKYLKDDLITYVSMPKTFDFLEDDDDEDSSFTIRKRDIRTAPAVSDANRRRVKTIKQTKHVGNSMKLDIADLLPSLSINDEVIKNGICDKKMSSMAEN